VITTQTGPQPADFTDVRATNLAVVLRFVRVNAPCSRADIAASTGLNKTTVSSLVGELIDRRLLRETGLTEHRIGRPATMIVMDGAPYAAIGLEVSTDYLAAAAMDLAGDRLLSWRRSYPGGGAGGGGAGGARRAVAAVAALARRAVSRARDEGREVLGVSVGVPGLVDADGTVRLATNLAWADVPLRADLIEALGDPAYPVTVENDANLAVAAEYRYGPHAGTANLVYLTGQLGIGAGIIADGRPLRGARGYSGELGHITVDPSGPACTCGRRGCLEAVAGIGSLLDRLGMGAAAPLTDVEPAVEEVTLRAQQGDPAVLAALTDLGHRLGSGVSILANLVNPEVVILGGYFVPLAPWVLPPADDALRAGTLAPMAGGCRLAASTLGHSAAAVGGAAGVLDTVDSGRLPVAAPR
jgi:predicted NBD/HSP70 family sugar kinase